MAEIKIKKKHKKKTYSAIKPKVDVKEPSIVLQKKRTPEMVSKIQKFHKDKTGAITKSKSSKELREKYNLGEMVGTGKEALPHKRKFKIVKGKRVYKKEPFSGASELPPFYLKSKKKK